MLEKLGFKRSLSKEEEIESLAKRMDRLNRDLSKSSLKGLDYYDYTYSVGQATEELGLDDELVWQLIDDYIAQIIRTKPHFELLLGELEKAERLGVPIDYGKLRDLAHKNLGVAKNLRINDGITLLKELHKSDDIEHMKHCLDALEACAIRLNPTKGYDAKKLLEIKHSL